MTEIIRTPTRATGGITDEERRLMEENTKLWVKRAYRTEPIEPDKIIPAIEGLYAVAGLAKPIVVIAPSPLVMACAYGAAATIWEGGKYDGGVVDYRYNEATYHATTAAVQQATGHTVAWGPAYLALLRGGAVGLDPAEGAKAGCVAMAGQKGLEQAAQWTTVYQGGNMWASWESYLTAARDVLGLRFPEHEPYAFWEQAAIHGGYRAVHEKFCIVSDFPEVIKIDDQNRPHCSDGPSHRWRDGWSLYYWHGTAIPAEWIENPSSLTPEVALKVENIEQRRAACELLGWVYILAALKAKVLDHDPDPMIGDLVEVNLPDAGKEKFLRVLCGTGRTFALPMPPEVRTAREAQAWSYGMDPATFVLPELRT